ncbi:MAG: 3-hydroxybenzoate 6-monooxygenase [Anderseniella sp.]|jgi:salicylate hydroxylase|nr:3-hydroxybenzoate 6-monooxygenase [Anderseniella sp.]
MKPILIAGGGIGGFAAALALARKGLESIVVERETELREAGAGIQLGPNVFAMFDALGLTEAINEVAVFPEALVMKDALDGSEVTRIPLNTAAFNARFRYPYGVIYRPDLHNALIGAVRATGMVDVQLGGKVTGFEDAGPGVRVSLASGGTLEGAALIGADGLWSKVRESIVGDGPPRVSGHIAYRAVLPEAEVPEANHRNEVILWAGPKTHLVHYPLHRGDIFNLVAVFHSDACEEGWDVFGDVDELSRKFAGQRPEVLGMLDRIDSWRMWVLCDRDPVKTWSKGRVTLLGDAAHPMLQYLAQGACMATEDAVCLAHHMADKSDPAEAFLAYQADRYLRTARVQMTARLYGDIYHAAGPVAELRRMMLSGRTAEQAYNGVSWLYAGVDAHGRQTL